MGIGTPLEIQQNGYIYIWLSNESKEARVWFDDLTITHEEHFVVQATDYGVWGDVIREQKSDIASYRYGYQGQFAEKDKETEWSHFELREYDAVVARWTAPDPMAQFWSPYLGMGNNPAFYTDPRGGCVDAQGKVIPCNGADDGLDGFHTTILPEMTVSAGVSFDAMTFEYDYAGTFTHYQQSFPEFSGMSQAEAMAHWNEKYSGAFYKQWQESVQREKDRENLAKLGWFNQAFSTAGAVAGGTVIAGAFAGSNLATPTKFNHSPRGIVVRPQLKLNSKKLGSKFGEHLDPSLPGYRSSTEYRDLIHKIYNDPNSLYRVIPNNARIHAGEHHFYNNGNLLRLGPDGSFRSLYPIK